MNPPLSHPLVALVTGMEHSFTTYLSRAMLVHPRINSGFECGLLLADSPAEFHRVQPFYGWMTGASPGQWQIAANDMERVCAATSWEEAYRRIVRYSPLFRDEVNLLIDKTPAYIRQLDVVLDKIPGTPCVVAVKDTLLQFGSYKKRGWKLEQFIDHYMLGQQSLREAGRRHGGRIMLVKHRELIEDTVQVLKRIFAFVDLELEDSELLARALRALNRHYYTREPGHPEYCYEDEVAAGRRAVSHEERVALEALPALELAETESRVA